MRHTHTYTQASFRILFVSGVITAAPAQMNANAALFVRTHQTKREPRTAQHTQTRLVRLCESVVVMSRRRQMLPPERDAARDARAERENVCAP